MTKKIELLKTDDPDDKVQVGRPFRLTITYIGDGDAILEAEGMWTVAPSQVPLPEQKAETEVTVTLSHPNPPSLPRHVELKASLGPLNNRRILLEVIG